MNEQVARATTPSFAKSRTATAIDEAIPSHPAIPKYDASYRIVGKGCRDVFSRSKLLCHHFLHGSVHPQICPFLQLLFCHQLGLSLNDNNLCNSAQAARFPLSKPKMLSVDDMAAYALGNFARCSSRVGNCL